MQRRPRAGLSVHRVPLAPDEVTRRRTIPVTTAQRTLLDLAGVLGPRALRRAVNEAAVLRLPDAPSLGELVARHPRARGVGALRALLRSGQAGLTRSELEDAFLTLVDRAELPRPRVNLVLEHARGRVEADCVWPHAGVVVELDGYASHGTRLAFERDRARDRALQVAGWRVVRVTWRQLVEQPDAIAAELRALLGRETDVWPVMGA